jgi:hypothetical protein
MSRILSMLPPPGSSTTAGDADWAASGSGLFVSGHSTPSSQTKPERGSYVSM